MAHDVSSLSLSVTSPIVSGVVAWILGPEPLPVSGSVNFLSVALDKWLSLLVPQLPSLLHRAAVLTQPAV